MEIPVSVIALAGMLATMLVGIIGYLLRGMISSTQKKHDELDAKIDAHDRFFAQIDKRFVEEELAFSKAYIDKESWTRDYVTLTHRVDALHKRCDRIESRIRDDATGRWNIPEGD